MQKHEGKMNKTYLFQAILSRNVKRKTYNLLGGALITVAQLVSESFCRFLNFI